MTQSVEVNIAVIQEQLKRLLDDSTEAKASRARTHQEQEQQNIMLTKMDYRIAKIEAVIADNQPTWQQFRDMQLKVQGAGWLGRVLWISGGVLISFAFWLVATLQKWFHP